MSKLDYFQRVLKRNIRSIDLTGSHRFVVPFVENDVSLIQHLANYRDSTRFMVGVLQQPQ